MTSSSLSVFDIYMYVFQTVTVHLAKVSALIRAISGTRAREKEAENDRSSWLCFGNKSRIINRHQVVSFSWLPLEGEENRLDAGEP